MSADPSPASRKPVQVQSDATEAALAEILREVPRAIAEALNRFHTELDDLLLEHAGLWVAFGPKGRIAFAESKRELCQRCLLQGLNDDEYLIRKVAPVDDEIEVLWNA
jgi:hypothetical protein